MIINQFIINLQTGIQHNAPKFTTVYNKEVLKLIKLLIELNIIKNTQKIDGWHKIEVYLVTSIKTPSSVKITNMSSRKKQRNWHMRTLIQRASAHEMYILKTNKGYRDSNFCIKYNLSGATILKIGY